MAHRHGAGCGHTAVRHGSHIDYLREGHLEHPEGDTIQEHRIEVTEQNPDRCTPDHRCSEHTGHVHGPETAEHRHHETVPHGDHMDYLHEGRLHHHHDDHCDDHGPVQVVRG
jgi:hypothetical protein